MGADDETRELLIDRVALAEFTGACCKPGQWTPPQMRYLPPGRPVQPTVAASVRAGVAFLDERFPGWQEPQPGDAPWFQQVFAGDQRCLVGAVMQEFLNAPRTPPWKRVLRRVKRFLTRPLRQREWNPVKAFPQWFDAQRDAEETWW